MSSSYRARNAGRPAGFAIWQAMEQFRDGVEQRFAGPRMARGQVRTAILALLLEGPMHGYQMIREIEERSHGAWKPSPGSVYPTLQLLLDEGLLSADHLDGRKTYTLTEEGRQVAEAETGGRAPWESESDEARCPGSGLARAGIDLAQAAAQVQRMGSEDDIEEAIQAVVEARRQLYSILARR